MRDRKLLAVTAIVVAIILIGEVYVYTFDRDSAYGIEYSAEDTGIDIAITSEVSNIYDVLVIDNGDFAPSERCLIYFDSEYGEKLDDTWHATGGRDLDQEFYVSQLKLQLENRGVDAEIIDAEGFREAVLDHTHSHDSIVVVSGALPDTVYTGNADDPIVSWIGEGGRLYWAGNLLGAYVSHSDGSVEAVTSDYQMILFGNDCLNTDGSEKGYDEIDNGLTDILSLAGNGTIYGVDPTAVDRCLTAGFTDGKFASMAFVGRGDGMICVLGGVLSNDQRSDLAQAVASGLSHRSVIMAHEHGSVTRSTEKLHVDVDLESNVSVYTYLGGYYTVYGSRGDFR